MQIELYIAAFVTIAYVIFIGIALNGFLKLKKRSGKTADSKTKDVSFFSIVVSARNEQETIVEFIHQLVQQSFSKKQFELILIDDASEDGTYTLAKQELERSELDYTFIHQKEHKGKKKNIAQAISLSKGSVIITTDADVIFRAENWLSTIADYFENNDADILIMPVDFKSQPGFLSQFQIFENLALTGITAGYAGNNKPFLCNGANLAFKKNSYESVNGYQSHMSISSGEDIFLLESLKKLENISIQYLLSKEVIVKTNPQQNLATFFNQRIRWAYKAKYNSNWLNIMAGTSTILSNFIPLALCIALFKNPTIVPFLSIFTFLKLLFDFLLLFLAANFLNRLYYLGYFIPISFLYWLYAILVGITSLFYKPYWKGKKIN